MIVTLGILAGLVLAVGIIRVARSRGPASEMRIYGIGLLVAALVYVGFALAGRAGVRWLALEVLGVVLFGGLAWLGLRRWPAALVLGWATHVAWDFGLHLDGAGAAFTPAWYPWLCVGFDVALAGAVLAAGRLRQPTVLAFALYVFGVGSASAQTSDATDSRKTIKKVSRQMVWEPGPEGKQIPLWPASVELERPESVKPEEVGNGSRLVAGRPWHWASPVAHPTMTIYPPKGRNTLAAILVLPGGGYQAVAMDLEGTEVCDWITNQGITCIVLKYRVPQTWRHDRIETAPKVQLPLRDAQRAMGLLRHRAASYGIDPHKIGVMGFSAGGHLAAAVSNAEKRTYKSVDGADRESSRPDFAILLYPGHLWDDRSRKTTLKLAPWVEIKADAPPTLLIHSMNDPTDDVRHSLAYGLALNDVGVKVDMRLYARGGHAFGIRPTPDPITTEWPGLVEKWLRNIRVF